MNPLLLIGGAVLLFSMLRPTAKKKPAFEVNPAGRAAMLRRRKEAARVVDEFTKG